MHIVIVSGMLGAGKTSVILKLVEPLVDSGLKSVIIENEFGSIGVDGEVIERGGVEVRDMKGGCVCCTLKTGLIDTLRALQAGIDPDIVIVEPTGIADPELIHRAVEGVTGLTVDKITTYIVIDAERFEKMKRMFERPLKNQLEVADRVLVNKVDSVNAKEIESITNSIRGYGYTGPMSNIRADTGEGMDAVTSELGL